MRLVTFWSLNETCRHFQIKIYWPSNYKTRLSYWHFPLEIFLLTFWWWKESELQTSHASVDFHLVKTKLSCMHLPMQLLPLIFLLLNENEMQAFDTLWCFYLNVYFWMRKRELVAELWLCSCCDVSFIVLSLFLWLWLLVMHTCFFWLFDCWIRLSCRQFPL